MCGELLLTANDFAREAVEALDVAHHLVGAPRRPIDVAREIQGNSQMLQRFRGMTALAAVRHVRDVQPQLFVELKQAKAAQQAFDQVVAKWAND